LRDHHELRSEKRSCRKQGGCRPERPEQNADGDSDAGGRDDHAAD
jgi:hypothetical protein